MAVGPDQTRNDARPSWARTDSGRPVTRAREAAEMSAGSSQHERPGLAQGSGGHAPVGRRGSRPSTAGDPGSIPGDVSALRDALRDLARRLNGQPCWCEERPTEWGNKAERHGHDARCLRIRRLVE